MRYVSVYSANLMLISVFIASSNGQWLDLSAFDTIGSGSNGKETDMHCGGDFQCDEYRCVPSVSVCDGVPDCSDGTDEESCHTPLECSLDEHRCIQGECIPALLVCNGIIDCGDGSDEENCTRRSQQHAVTAKPPSQQSPNHSGPTHSTFSSETVYIVEGKTEAIINCSYPSYMKPNSLVIWTKVGVPSLQENAHQMNNSLIIQNVSKRDSGLYICGIYSDDDVHGVYTEIYVGTLPTIELSTDLPVRMGQSVIIECIVRGENISSVTWQALNTTSESLLTDGNKLIFYEIRDTDLGTYKCTAKNNFGTVSAITRILQDVETRILNTEDSKAHNTIKTEACPITDYIKVQLMSVQGHMQFARKKFQLAQLEYNAVMRYLSDEEKALKSLEDCSQP